jgi:hypothetical protein
MCSAACGTALAIVGEYVTFKSNMPYVIVALLLRENSP